jgi:hypothetical protein
VVGLDQAAPESLEPCGWGLHGRKAICWLQTIIGEASRRVRHAILRQPGETIEKRTVRADESVGSQPCELKTGVPHDGGEIAIAKRSTKK